MIVQKAIQSLKRGSYLTLALSMLGVWVAADGILLQRSVSAEQMGQRRLTITSSANGTVNIGSRGTGTNGAYTKHAFDFTPTTATNIGSIEFLYCTTPLPGTACTPPTGLDASTVTTIAGTDAAGWSFGAATANSIRITRAPAALSTTSKNFTFGNGPGDASTNYIKNPTTDNQTFFVRISTFSDAAYTTAVDNGTVANSTAQQIDITAKVQEVLNFSVGTTVTAPGTACDPFTDSGALILGDPIDGVLSFAQAYDARSYFRVSTNANNGTSVLYSGNTLRSGGNSVAAIGTTAAASAPGTSQFGLAIDDTDIQAGSGHSFTSLSEVGGAVPDGGEVVGPTDYSHGEGTITNAGTALFGFDPASITSPVEIAHAAGTITCDTGAVRYLGNISTTTPPGIYTTGITFLVTPTY